MTTSNNFFLTETKVLKTTKPVFKTQPEEYSGIYSFLTNYNTERVSTFDKKMNLDIQLASRVSTKGKIKFCNSDFEVCTGYKQNQQYTDTIHPEMPKTIFKAIISKLNKGENVIAIIKHIDKNNNTYWLNTLYSPNNTNKHTIAFSVKGTITSKKAIQKINKIYNVISSLEQKSELVAQKYYMGLLEMEYGNYEGILINAFQ